MFPYAYKLKNKFQVEEEGIRNIFCEILDPATIQDCTKFLKFLNVITNVLLKIIERYHQRSMLPTL